MRGSAGFIQAALNGARHAMTAQRLAAEAAAVARLGCTSVHLHPFDGDRESLAPDVVAAAVAAVRAAAPGVEVGVSTGEWIAPDVPAAIARWVDPLPDMASVNLSEPHHAAVMAVLLERGIAIEAGLFSSPDADLLAASGHAGRVRRALIEPTGGDEARQTAIAAGLERRLDGLAIGAPRLHHGDGPHTWAVLRAARRRNLAVRIGLEDTDVLPDGTPVAENEPLYAAAQAL